MAYVCLHVYDFAAQLFRVHMHKYVKEIVAHSMEASVA